ncbi:MAG TPA: rod shape-determining protein MreD [Treponemataceae bacterium]|nr:rod shape-determining protein MreD [Treponemataceae bacterium]
MVKTLFWTSVTVLFLALCNASILSNLTFLPAVPDLVLLVALYVSFMNSSAFGATTGFFTGLILDFISAAPIGLNAITKTITCFITGKLHGSFNLDLVFIPALMGCIATLLKAFFVLLLSILFGLNIQVYHFFSSVFWFEVLINTVCAPIIFALLGLFKDIFVIKTRGFE